MALKPPGLRVISYNLFKGRNWWSGRSALSAMGAALARYSPDIVLLQEIRGGPPAPDRRPPGKLAVALGFEQAAYGMNFRGRSTTHGNAIFARRSILHMENCDLSVSRLERRGVLTAECELSAALPRVRSIRLFCTHLDLTRSGRMKQLDRLSAEIERRLNPREEPFILAGDFNDWNLECDR
mgnify:FL=1